jgi:hypothetical protein
MKANHLDQGICRQEGRTGRGAEKEAFVRRFWKVAAVAAVVAVLGVAALAAVVVAQEPQGQGQGWFSDLRQELHAAIAAKLGTTVEQYDAAVTQAREEVITKAVQDGKITQQQADRMLENGMLGFGPGMMGGRGAGRGMMGGGYGPMMGGSANSLVAVAAEKLDMTVADVQAQLQAGKTIAALAEEKGIDVQTIVDAFLAQRQEWLTQAVAEGRLTQAQADQMMENMREMVEQHIQGTLPFNGDGQGGCPGHRGGGMMNWGTGTGGRNF